MVLDRCTVIVVLALAASAVTASGAAGCSSKALPSASRPPDAGEGPSFEAGAPEAGSTGWSKAACGTCVIAQCSHEQGLCEAEPSCAVHAQCVEACPPDASGGPDSACVDACPRTDGTAAARARAAYDTCMRGGGRGQCPACTAAPTTGTPSVLSQACGASTETNACYKCEDEKCCQTYDACVAEPDCKQALQPCLVACKSDDACKQQCYSDHPKGLPAWAKRQACLLGNCVAACNGGAPVDPCVACSTITKCRDATAQCEADVGCFVLRACVDARCANGQVTDSCLATCKASAPATAAPLFDAMISCALLSCAAECG